MCRELSLENRIKTEIISYDGMMGVYINDLKGNIIKINEKEQFETASTIKVFIMAALFKKIEEKNASLSDKLIYEKKYDAEGSGILCDLEYGTVLSVKNLATLMIIISDNIAANMLIEYIGIKYINEAVQALGFKNTMLYNILDFENYHRLGTTTPEDYGKIFEEIAQEKLISRNASQEMFKILKKQHYNTMLTQNIPPYYLDPDNYDKEIISFASKSGSMNACRNDGGIVTTPYGKYIIVLFNKNFSDRMYYNSHPALVFGSRVSRLVFEQYLALKGRLEL